MHQKTEQRKKRANYEDDIQPFPAQRGAQRYKVIMPNHIHFIVEITNGRGTSRRPSPTRADSAIPKYISTFKRFTNKNSKVSLWQRSYYDHIIRNETDYLEKLNYIKTNPHRWSDDEYFIQ